MEKEKVVSGKNKTKILPRAVASKSDAIVKTSIGHRPLFVAEHGCHL
jgi:hypothetical protein